MVTVNDNQQLKEKLQNIIVRMFSIVKQPSVVFEFWDGTTLPFTTESPKLTVILKNPEAISDIILRPTELALSEAYFYDYFDLKGDLREAVRVGEQLALYNWSKKELLGLAGGAISLGLSALAAKTTRSFKGKGKLHTINRDKEAIAYHYDTSNRFFSFWLDKNMVYSGAYFPHPEATLDEAQTNKLDYICKKLRLKEGETLLDIGCGWGALVIHAAQKYRVKATGITLSKQQMVFANERIAALGLQDICEVKYADYRELPENEIYDKISSVEMLHHVGKEMLPEYYRTIKKHLKPDGISFQLSVTSVPARTIPKSPEFIDKYFQPDFLLLPISTLTDEAEKNGFELFEVENVREHYRLTALHWLKNLEAAHDSILTEVNEFTYRVLRLSLFMLVLGFERGEAGFYHFTLMNKKCSINTMPFNRQT